MAIKNKKRGFALLVAVIFMSVMLSFGLALGSLSYKQQVLASSAIASQYAFYAADAALECLLYADQQLNLFEYTSITPPSVSLMTCDVPGSVAYPPGYPTGIVSHTGTQWVVTERLSLDAGKHCADVTISKPALGAGATYLYTQGYDVSCATVANPNGARFSSRGLTAHY